MSKRLKGGNIRCDPDNRLIAAQLEKSWEAALRRVEVCVA